LYFGGATYFLLVALVTHTYIHTTSVDSEFWTPVILEAGTKFGFETKKHENPELLAASVEYLLFPVISKLV